jgi:hypothetical protein
MLAPVRARDRLVNFDKTQYWKALFKLLVNPSSSVSGCQLLVSLILFIHTAIPFSAQRGAVVCVFPWGKHANPETTRGTYSSIQLIGTRSPRLSLISNAVRSRRSYSVTAPSPIGRRRQHSKS